MQYDYEVISVPPGCTAFQVGDTLRRTINGVPPQTITLENIGSCSGTVLQLIE